MIAIPMLSELIKREVKCLGCKSGNFCFSHNKEKKAFVCTCNDCGDVWEEHRDGPRK